MFQGTLFHIEKMCKDVFLASLIKIERNLWFIGMKNRPIGQNVWNEIKISACFEL